MNTHSASRSFRARTRFSPLAALTLVAAFAGAAVAPASAEAAIPSPASASISTGATGADRIIAPLLTEGERFEVVLADETDFMDDHPDVAAVTVGADSLTFSAKAGKALDLRVGRILVSRQNQYLRKITSVTGGGTNPYVVRTSQATLRDAFKKIDIEGYAEPRTATSGSSSSTSRSSIWEGQIIDVNTSKSVTHSVEDSWNVVNSSNLDITVNASLTATTKLWLKLYWDIAGSDRGLQFGASVKSTLDASGKVVAQATGSFGTGDKEVSVAQLGRVAWDFGPVAGILDLDLVLNYEVNATATVTAGVDIGFDGMEVRGGAQYKNGSWSKINEFTAPTFHSDHVLSAGGTITAKVVPAVEAAVLFYGIAGPEVTIGPRFSASATRYGSTSVAAGSSCFTVDQVCGQVEANGVLDLLGFVELAELNLGTWNFACTEGSYVTRQCF